MAVRALESYMVEDKAADRSQLWDSSNAPGNKGSFRSVYRLAQGFATLKCMFEKMVRCFGNLFAAVSYSYE